MKKNQPAFINKNDTEEGDLKTQIIALKVKLLSLQSQVRTFEAMLKAELAQEIILIQELSVLYKKQKAAKKVKRQEQKKKGKNYIAPNGLKIQKRAPKEYNFSDNDIKEKKRLYREAMLLVHPDTFASNEDKIDLATELTTRLIDIYKNEDLDTLKNYHAHLFNQEGLNQNVHNRIMPSVSPEAYLLNEKMKIENEIAGIKKRRTYEFLISGKDSSFFVEELKQYYNDRIMKLRRRTRVRG